MSDSTTQTALEHALCCRAWVERKERQGDTIGAGLWRKEERHYEAGLSHVAIDIALSAASEAAEAFRRAADETERLFEEYFRCDGSIGKRPLLCCSVPRQRVEGQQQGELSIQPIARGTAGAAALSRRSRHLRGRE